MGELQRELQRLGQLPQAVELVCQEVAELRVLVTDLPSIKAQLADLQVVTARRCDTQQEVGKLKEQLKKLTGTVVKKIEEAQTEHMNHVNAELKALHAMVNARASQERLERLERKVDQELKQLLDSTSRLVQVEARLDILAGSSISRNEDVEHLEQELQTFQDRNDSRFADLQSRCHDLSSTLSAQDPASVLEQLNGQYRTLSTALSQKSDRSEMEQLKHQLNTLGSATASKVEGSIADQLGAQYRAMAAAVAALGKEQATTEAAREQTGLPPLDQPFLTCVATLQGLTGQVQALSQNVQVKADKSRVDQLIEQFQMLADMLAPKLNTKPRHRTPARPQSARAGLRSPLEGTARSLRSTDGL